MQMFICDQVLVVVFFFFFFFFFFVVVVIVFSVLCFQIFTITKTCLYIFDPLKPHFDIVKLGSTGVYIIFLISAQKHRLWVLVTTAPSRRFYRVPIIYVLS